MGFAVLDTFLSATNEVGKVGSFLFSTQRKKEGMVEIIRRDKASFNTKQKSNITHLKICNDIKGSEKKHKEIKKIRVPEHQVRGQSVGFPQIM